MLDSSTYAEAGSAFSRSDMTVEYDPHRLTVASQIDTPMASTWGAVTLGEDELAELEACLSQPQTPTPSMLEAAELLRSLRRTR